MNRISLPRIELFFLFYVTPLYGPLILSEAQPDVCAESKIFNKWTKAASYSYNISSASFKCAFKSKCKYRRSQA